MKTLEERKIYWTKQLSGAPALALPLDQERPPVSSFLRETASLALPPDDFRKLAAFAAEEGASALSILMAAFTAILSRYTGQTDVLVGSLLGPAPDSDQPVLAVIRAQLDGHPTARELVRQIDVAASQAAVVGDCPSSSLTGLRGHAEAVSDAPLFSNAFVFRSSAAPAPRAVPDPFQSGFADDFARCDVVVVARAAEDGGLAVHCDYDAELFDPSTIQRLLEHFGVLLRQILAEPAAPLASLSMLTPTELRQLLVEWNDTKTDFPTDACIHRLFEAQAARTPEAGAVAFREQTVTYGQLNARANQLAHCLRRLGVGPDTLVGICVERSLEMIVGLLGVLKAGGAYVPLDPSYPRERLSFMLKDAQVPVLLTQERLLQDLPEHAATVVCLDSAGSEFAKEPEENPANEVAAGNLAYVIYTSGSTGKPKGVMISHRNVVNFFTGMDRRIGGDRAGVWLAVTSISFDISVLELFWTLCRGFKVVIYKDEYRRTDRSRETGAGRRRKMDFSLLYFASDAGQDSGNRYRLLLEGAKFADQHGFDAVWTPERHFHAFGGLYPNPSVTSAAVAAVTERIKIRAGSVVLPLQHPIRVAEEWSMVDNLSRGRVGVSFASGWQINDFVLAPHNYAARKDVMLREIDTVRRLWRGETLSLPGVDGKPVPVRILPRPIQPELPIWITATGNPETCRVAGQVGANLLTHLVGQKIEDLADKIRIYRKAWQEKGHAGEGHVTLMLHTFVGDNLDAVRETVREPFSNYLKTSVDLLKNSPWGFAPARLGPGAQVKKHSTAPAELTEEELAALLEHAFDRYFENSSLFGTPEVCLRMVDQLREIGVTEIACLIDFGVDSQTVLDSLRLLNEVRERSNQDVDEPVADYSLTALARRHGVTHFQCTPSMAEMLAGQPDAEQLFGRLDKLMIGGEAFPPALARQLKRSVRGSIHNMYGPTETTVWSTTQTVSGIEGAVSIGRPIANTEIYLLDRHFQPVPVGVAGELCIGGAGVVRGYLNRSELTAEKFIRNPFTAEPDARIYRTGDLARYRSDGSIEFLGRMDHQVKIRGHRIELPEIEAVLGQHASVRESAVIAREDVPGDKRVVAYVVWQPGVPREAKVLRSFLLAQLPEYMVPSAFVSLDRLPQTPNGKIDRRALPAPEGVQESDARQFVAPRTPVEEVLADLWVELLGVDRVGAEDNFFELGGHSLLATQLITRLREIFRVELPLGIIFEAATVSGLAAFMIAHESKPGLTEKTALILKQIEDMSETEVNAKLQAGRPA
jgi:natural product biosynthesis luciferase-like monooxygenase protein